MNVKTKGPKLAKKTITSTLYSDDQPEILQLAVVNGITKSKAVRDAVRVGLREMKRLVIQTKTAENAEFDKPQSLVTAKQTTLFP